MHLHVHPLYFLLFLSINIFAEEPKATQNAGTATSSSPKATSNVDPGAPPEEKKVRNFYRVLEEVLGDFELDLKQNEVRGLRDLSIRNVVTSENVPPSSIRSNRQRIQELFSSSLIWPVRSAQRYFWIFSCS